MIMADALSYPLTSFAGEGADINRIGEEERGDVDDGGQGDGGMEVSEKTDSQVEKVNIPTDLKADVNHTYISIEPSKDL